MAPVQNISSVRFLARIELEVTDFVRRFNRAREGVSR